MQNFSSKLKDFFLNSRIRHQDYFDDFFLRVILRFIFHLETILKTIYSENSCQIENSPQNSLQTENEP